MNLQIKAGKYYITRDGRKIGPMIRKGVDVYDEPFVWGADSGGVWSHNGEDGYVAGPIGSETPGDLVAEWVAEVGTLVEIGAKPGDTVVLVKNGICRGHSEGCIGTVILKDGELKTEGKDMNRGDTFGHKFRIVTKHLPDLTAIEKPFGLLDAETKYALRNHGGPYERWNGNNWTDAEKEKMASWIAYRVKPEQIVETLKRSLHGDDFMGYVAIDAVDGVLDWSTIRKWEDK